MGGGGARGDVEWRACGPPADVITVKRHPHKPAQVYTHSDRLQLFATFS